MIVYVVSAFEDRREQAVAEAKRVVSDADVRVVEAPLGREVEARGWQACPFWRDPYQGKRLMTWGEMACFAGHYDAWRRIVADDRPAIIVEDDLQVIRPVRDGELQGSLTYIGGKPMGEIQDNGGPLLPAPYMYWTVGYYLTPDGANSLINGFNPEQVIPVDEFIPYHYGVNPNVDPEWLLQRPSAGFSAWMVRDTWVVSQDHEESGTEQSPPAFDLHTVIFATDPSRVDLAPWKAMGYEPTIIGKGQPEWDTRGRGGIQKMRWLREHLQGKAWRPRDAWDVVLAVDGYDTMPVVKASDLMQRWAEMNHKIVVGGETICWPDKALAGHERFKEGPYRYPCSGTIMGFAGTLLQQLAPELSTLR